MLTVEADDWAKLFTVVKKFEPDLGKSLRRELTQAANPVRDAVRSAALALPSSGGGAESYRKKRGSVGGGAGLRQGLAAATETKVNPTRPGDFSIRIRVSGSRFASTTGKPASLARLVEGPPASGPWRHPVFGTPRWVTQDHTPFLIDTAARFKPQVQAAVQKALQSAVDEVIRSIL